MSGSQEARRVVSAYLADPGGRARLRAHWPGLALALDALVQEGAGNLASRETLAEIGDRWRAGPWGRPPGRAE